MRRRSNNPHTARSLLSLITLLLLLITLTLLALTTTSTTFITLVAAAAGAFDPYRVLGLTRSASSADITKAYRKQARVWHPDKHSTSSEKDKETAHSKFAEIASAYEILSDTARKREYDQFGTYSTSAAGGGQRQQNNQYQQQQQYYGGGGYGYYYQQQAELQRRYSEYLNSLTAQSNAGHQPLIIKLHADSYEQTLKRRGGSSFFASSSASYRDYPAGVGSSSTGPDDGLLRLWLVYIYSDPCGQCTRVTPVIQSVAEQLHGVVRVGSVHSDFESGLVAQKLGVRYTPSLLVVSARDGVLHTVSINSLTGNQPLLQLTASSIINALSATYLLDNDRGGLGAPAIPLSNDERPGHGGSIRTATAYTPAQTLVFITPPPPGHPYASSYSYAAGGMNRNHKHFIVEKLAQFRTQFGYPGTGRTAFIILSKQKHTGGRPHFLFSWLAERWTVNRRAAFGYVNVVGGVSNEQWSELVREYRIPPSMLHQATGALKQSIMIVAKEPGTPYTYLRLDDSDADSSDDDSATTDDSADTDIGMVRQRDRLLRVVTRYAASLYVPHITVDNYYDRCFRRESKWRKLDTDLKPLAGGGQLLPKNGQTACLIHLSGNTSSVEAVRLLTPLISSKTVGFMFSDGRRIEERSTTSASTHPNDVENKLRSREDGEIRELDADDPTDPSEWQRRGFVQAGWITAGGGSGSSSSTNHQSEWMALISRAFPLSARRPITASDAAATGAVPAVTATAPQFVLVQPTTQKLLVYTGARISEVAGNTDQLAQWLSFAFDPNTQWVEAQRIGGIPFIASEPDEQFPIPGAVGVSGTSGGGSSGGSAWSRWVGRLEWILSPLINAFKPSGLSIDTTANSTTSNPIFMFLPLLVTALFVILSTRTFQL